MKLEPEIMKKRQETFLFSKFLETIGLEPMTLCVQSIRSTN